jgi:hypothetical protein
MDVTADQAYVRASAGEPLDDRATQSSARARNYNHLTIAATHPVLQSVRGQNKETLAKRYEIPQGSIYAGW